LNIALASIAFLLALKFVCWMLRKKYGYELPLLAITVTRFHIMLIGAASAILYYKKNNLFISIATHKITQLVSWSVLFLIALNRFHIASVIDAELVSVVSVCLIAGQITRKNRIINLENKLCDFIGKISYGIYVIHPLLIYYCSRLLGRFSKNSPVNYILIYVLIIAITILLAYLSYELYEKRFLKLKAKYSTVKSVSSR